MKYHAPLQRLNQGTEKTPNSFYGSGVQECVIPHEFLFLFPFKDAGEIILNKMLGSLQPAWEYFSLWAHDGILSPTGDQIKRMQNFQGWKQCTGTICISKYLHKIVWKKHNAGWLLKFYTWVVLGSLTGFSSSYIVSLVIILYFFLVLVNLWYEIVQVTWNVWGLLLLFRESCVLYCYFELF